MEGDLNKVLLMGRVARDPELTITKRGDRCGRFLLITHEAWFDKSNGTKRTKSVAHMVVVYGEHLLRVVEKCIRRGAYLYIEGQLDIRKWKAKNSPIESWTCETVVHGWSGRISVLDFGGDIASYHNRDLDDFEEPPTPLSIKRSMAKHDSAMVDDVDDSGLQRFLGEPDDHAPAERRAAGDDRRNA